MLVLFGMSYLSAQTLITPKKKDLTDNPLGLPYEHPIPSLILSPDSSNPNPAFPNPHPPTNTLQPLLKKKEERRKEKKKKEEEKTPLQKKKKLKKK